MGEAVDQASKKFFESQRLTFKRIVDRTKPIGDTKRKEGLSEGYLTYLIL